MQVEDVLNMKHIKLNPFTQLDRKLSSPLIAAGVAVLLLGASPVTPVVAQPAAQSDTASRVRLVHASPDAPPVDVYVDGKKIFTDVGYRKVTDYASVKAGQHLLQIVPTGKTVAQGPVVIRVSVTTEAAKDYSVLAIGRLTHIAPLILSDDNTLPAPGKTLVRFVHVSPDSPAVDVVVSAASSLSPQKLFSKIAFKNASQYTPLDAGTVDLSVRVAGTDVSAAALKGLALAPQTVVTVYTFGLSTATPALSIGVSVDVGPVLAKTPILPVTGAEPSTDSSVAVVLGALGALLIAISIVLRGARPTRASGYRNGL